MSVTDDEWPDPSYWTDGKTGADSTVNGHGEPFIDMGQYNDDGTRKETPPTWLSRIATVGDSWYREAPPLRDWLLRDSRTNEQRGWLPQGKACLLIAEGGAGKTTALIQGGHAVGKGSAWFNTFAVEKAGRVFMLLGEEEADEVRRRIYNAHAGIGSPPLDGMIEILPMAGESCALVERDGRGGAVETAFASELRDYLVKNGPWSLIIAEPLSRIGGPDMETDPAAATKLVQTIESIVKLTGATTLCAHHTNKVSRGGISVDSSSSRGQSALTDGFRWVASLACRKSEELGEEVVTLAVVKSNYSFKGDPLLLRRADGGRLEPLGAEDAATFLGETRGDAARAERRAEREAEREATLEQRAAAEASRRAQREAEAEEARRRRAASDVAIAREIMAGHPSAEGRVLRGLVKAALGCGSDRADAAIALAVAGARA